MAPLRNVVRIEEARDEVDRLRAAFARWQAHWESHEQYATQLATLAEAWTGGLEEVAKLEGVAATDPTGEVYERCLRTERRVVFLRRYWEYFRSKWDQREEAEPRGGAVRSADEIVWSCWKAAWDATGQEPGPAPLPYLEAYWTPRAISRVKPPPDLKLLDEVLGEALSRLPIPLIGLPPVCEVRPWWLVLLAHETGHHVQHDVGGGKLRTAFPELVARVAEAAGEDPETWIGRSDELFADAFGVLCCGPAAAWAIGELVESNDEAMLRDTPGYPAPAVRIAVMRAVLESAGVDSLGGVPRLPAGAVVTAHATDIAEAITHQSLGDLPTLPVLAGWRAQRFLPAGEVEEWQAAWMGNVAPEPQATLRAARLAVAGAAAAWIDVATDAEAEQRAQRRDRLADRVRETLPACRAPGRRYAPATAVPDLSDARTALAEALFADDARLAEV